MSAMHSKKGITVRQRNSGSFGFILLLMSVVAAIAYTRLARIEQQATDVRADSLLGMEYSAQILTNWVMNHALTQHHVLSADRTEMQVLEEKLQANQAQTANLLAKFEATSMSAEQREPLDAFKNVRSQYLAIQDQVVRASSDPQTKPEAVRRLALDLEPAFRKSQETMQGLVDTNRTQTYGAAADIVRAIAAAKTGILVLYAVALLLALVSGYYLLRGISQPLRQLAVALEVMRTGDFTQRVALGRRDEFGALADGFDRMTDELAVLVGQVQQSGTQVNSSVAEIAATSKQQQAMAIEVGATTTQIGATSKEISATSKELVRTMNEVAAVAEQSATLAGSGQAGLAQMEETMRHVMEASGSINAKLAVLNEKAGNISQVVTTITKVADQTNLLSLNAAIEAEKAGEYGRGFAVVATEIRRLADQTAVATYDIEQMVKEIQSAVSAGVMGMDKFSEEVRRGIQEVQQVDSLLSQIIQQVQSSAPRIEAVNEGMQAQATGAVQITEALSQLGDAVQQTVASLRQSSQAIDELKQVAEGLRKGVSRFKLAA